MSGGSPGSESNASIDSRYRPEGGKTRWFFRGMAVGLLLIASVNAASYFVRSADWSSLIGPPKSNDASLGFPLIVWEAGNQYDGLFADYPNLALNILFATIVGSIIGALAASKTDLLNTLVASIADNEPSLPQRSQRSPIQFSLLGLMITTTIVAITVAVISQLAASPTTLIGIYALGPIGLVTLAMIPKHLAWQHRVILLIPITFGLITVAIMVGNSLHMEFDKVLMGIFLSWTPQSALAAIGLTTWIMMANRPRIS
jgi:hypothetical protein